MGKLFCMMGKSASGKDTIYRMLMEDASLDLHTVVPYTTRPIRAGEAEGISYWFVDEAGFQEMKSAGKIIEDRCYETVHGPWRYFTADDGQIDFSKGYFMVIGTLEAYCRMKEYFGSAQVVPIYINVEDGLRLARALERERQQEEPKYAEMCRRFLADSEDFSEAKIQASGIEHIFENVSLETCLAQVKAEILAVMAQDRKE